MARKTYIPQPVTPASSVVTPSIVDMIGELGARDMAEKIRKLAFRQDALETAVSETAQSLHARCHGHLGLPAWRDCFMEPCSKLRGLLADTVFVNPVDVSDH